MKRRLLIRVETIDGDVDFYEPSEDLCYYLDFQGLKVDQCAVVRKFYPEFRVNDLLITFGFFDADDSEVI